MPALPLTPSPVVHVKLDHQLSLGGHVVTSLFFGYSGGVPSNSEALNLAGAIGTAWATNLAGALSANCLLASVTLRDIQNANGAEGISIATHAGTRAGSDLPQSICAMMNHHLGRRYRGGKPRSYLPYGVIGDMGNDDVWSTSFVSYMNTHWASFTAAVELLTNGAITLGEQKNVSYYHGFDVVTNPNTGRARNVPKLRATPIVDNVVSSTLNKVFATQRRRLRP